MPWMELNLNPKLDWDETILPDWIEVLTTYVNVKEKGIFPSLENIPGYKVITLGDENSGELVMSPAERVVTLSGIKVIDSLMKELAVVVTRFARGIGAVTLRAPINFTVEEEFWKRMGAKIIPDPAPLLENIQREMASVESLYNFSLRVKYRNKPALCLEPIFCNTRPPGPASLAERRLSRLLGQGRPIGFASRISAYSPWQIKKNQWNDLLAHTRLKAYDILEEQVAATLLKEDFTL